MSMPKNSNDGIKNHIGHREYVLAGLFLRTDPCLPNYKHSHLSHNTTYAISPQSFEMIDHF
jgi:hypothetical protein